MEKELNIAQEGLSGTFSLKLANGQTLDDFCAQHVEEYNRDRFEALALRVFVGDETVITVFAVDKKRQEGSNFTEGRIPVKKFKLTSIALTDLFSYCDSFNCTLTTGNYNLEDMEVINK